MTGVIGRAYTPPIAGRSASRSCRRLNGQAHFAAFFYHFSWVFFLFPKISKIIVNLKKFRFTKVKIQKMKI
jgi:hypothetical protein